jgi:hypothetical protein
MGDRRINQQAGEVNVKNKRKCMKDEDCQLTKVNDR